MRNYAQGWRSDCDDLIEQKPQCVRLHMRIFVNEDHRKMNVRPQRKFASSRVTGIGMFCWLFFVVTAAYAANQQPLSASEAFVFSAKQVGNIAELSWSIAPDY